jgi:YVTN family beta-propeller protein
MQLVMKPDGGEIYASNFDAGSVVVINTAICALNGSFSVGRNPIRGAISRDGQRLYVANYGSNTVSVLDPPNNRSVIASIAVGAQPESLYLTADDLYLFVLNSGSNDVSVVRTDAVGSGSNALFAVIATGANPSAIVAK